MNRIELCAQSAFHGSATGPSASASPAADDLLLLVMVMANTSQWWLRDGRYFLFIAIAVAVKKANVTSSDQFWLTSHDASFERGSIMFRLESTLVLLLRMNFLCVEELQISSNIVCLCVCECTCIGSGQQYVKYKN